MEDRLGRIAHLSIGDPHHAPAGHLKHAIAMSIPLEGDGGAVRVAPVQLDHQPNVSPHGVDLEALHDSVDLRTKNAGAVDEAEEHLLQLALGDRRPGPAFFERRSDGAAPPMPRIAMKEVIEAELVPETKDLRFVDGALQLALRGLGGEVEDGAGTVVTGMPS